MKRFVVSLPLILTFLLPALAMAATSTWVIDVDHSSVQFKVKHLMVSNVKGEFKKFSGTVTMDDADITKSRVDVTIDAASIDTGVAKRDEHLKSPDFFDVAKYPTLMFVSTKVAKAGDNRLKVTGNLTLHGVTREVVLDVEGPNPAVKDMYGNTKSGASATTKINRKDFGLTWNKALEAGGVAVGEEVLITLDVELLKK
jgi:polyisoprenoid-binding protein YceI